MDTKILDTVGRKVLELGMHDAVVNGVLVTDIPSRVVFCKNTTERDAIKSKLQPGQFVVIYGLGNIYQLNGENGWETVR